MSTVVLSFLVAFGGLAYGGSGAGAPAPTGLDPAFLQLPAHDVAYVVEPTGKVRVGDQLQLEIQGIGDGTVSRVETQLGTDPLEQQGWEVVFGAGTVKAADAALAPTGRTDALGETKFAAVPLKAGKLTLPSLRIVDSKGVAVGRTNALDVEVESAIAADDPKPEEPVDALPPLGLPFPWWVVIVAVLVFAAGVAGVLYGLKRWSDRKGKFVPPPIPEGPPKPEDVVALEILAQIEREALMRKGQYKAHYFRVSEALKRYVGARYRFDAVESTTREIVAHFEEKRKAGDQVIDRLEGYLERLDRVKFTDYTPALDEGGEVLEEARKFILSTRRPPPVAPVLEAKS